jgi:hypothetical protein
MTFDPTQIASSIKNVYGAKPHPDAPEVKVRDYEAFARAAAMMFQEPSPTAEHVVQAYHSLTNAEIAPAEFERLWTVARPLSNRLLARDPTIHDLMGLVGQPPNSVQSYYMNHPHPQYPEASAGDIARYATVALYPARRLAGREPNLTELHKFAMGGYSTADVVAHYSDGNNSA